MNGNFETRNYKVRPSGKRGVEITLPSCLCDRGVFDAGDIVQVVFNEDVVAVVPSSRELDLEKFGRLVTAVGLARV